MTRGVDREPSRVYIVLVGSEEKNGVLSPTILGFEDDVARNAWLTEGGQTALDRWVQSEGELYGGWPTYYEIGPGLEESPAEWLASEEAYAKEQLEEEEGE